MRSPARAFAWEFLARHRWGAIAIAVYVLALIVVPPMGYPIELDPPNGMAAAVVVPLGATFLYFLAVFSFGISGDLAARRSMYPERMFTLPVTTAGLAGWPMLYGSVAMGGLWLMTASFAWWWRMDLPWIWPGLLAMVFLAWTQVLTWMPYGFPGLRVVAAVLWLPVLDAVIISAVHFRIPEWAMVAFLAPQLPLAYLSARYAVARARRGDVPDWSGGLQAADRDLGGLKAAAPLHFTSPESAQLWFEWRQHGRSLPVWVGILLPFELALLFLTDNDTQVLVVTAVVLALLTPPFMAAFAATAVSRTHGQLATLPATSGALVAAKLRMAVRSTLVAWLLVLVAIAAGLTFSNTWPIVMGWVDWSIEFFGRARAIFITLLALAALIASTWKQLVQNLCIGLSGRGWLIKANVFGTLSFLVVLGPLVHWVLGSRRVVVMIWDALPWIFAALVALKMTAAARIITRLHASRVVRERTLVISAAGWSIAVLALWGLLAWLFAVPHVPRYVFGLLAILLIPLARVSAAPLALDWNRHR